MRKTDVQRPRASRADLAFALVAVAAGATLVYLGRSLTFWEDEWRSIMFDGGPIDYLRPLNEHWSTVHLLLYRATFALVGLRSYVPYLAEVVVLHLVAVAGAYVLMRHRVGPLVATLVAIPLLLLGSGAENLFWGFQTGFVGSVMFGIWALLLVERSSRSAPLVASLLLVAGLASSGVGLFFLVVVAGRTLADAQLRRRASVVVPPLAVYLLWFLLIGREGVGTGGPVSLDPSTARFIARGVVHSVQSAVGLDHLPDGHLWGMVIFLVLAALTARRLVRGRPAPLAAGCVLGVFAMYTLIAVVRLRADPGYDHATSSRFVYVAAFLLALAVVDLLPGRSWWSALRGARRLVVPAAVVLAVGLATAANVYALDEKRSEFEATAERTRAFVSVVLTRGSERWVDQDEHRGWFPPVPELRRTIERHGSPLRDELFGVEIEAPDATALESALLALAGDAFRFETAEGHSVLTNVATGPGTSRAGRCALARFGPDDAVWALALPAMARVRVTSPSELDVRAFLAHEGGPGRPLYARLASGTPQDVLIPYVGDRRLWELAVDSPRHSGSLQVCVLLAEPDGSLHTPAVEVRRWE